jgi:hypothetical protein
MLRVENQAERDVSSGLPLALAVPRVDRRVVQAAEQNRTHRPPWQSAGTSRASVNEWDPQTKAGAAGQGNAGTWR